MMISKHTIQFGAALQAISMISIFEIDDLNCFQSFFLWFVEEFDYGGLSVISYKRTVLGKGITQWRERGGWIRHE